MKFKFLILALLTIIPSLGFAAVFGDFEYKTSKSGVTITKYTGAGASVVIPSQINNVAVTAIGESAFLGCSLTSVTIPNSVKSIEARVFAGCSGLTSVTIPNSVKSIAESAFSFNGLTSINVEEGNLIYKSINGVLFNKALTTIIKYPEQKSGSYEIPNSVTSIVTWWETHPPRMSAFSGCKGLTSVTIPSSMKTIGASAFAYCEGLTSVTIPNSVTSIGESAFYSCGLTSVTIPNSVTSIGKAAFYSCESLTSVTIPNSVKSIGDWAFLGCSGLTSVTIPSSVKSIGARAFYSCESLTSVTIPNSVTSIGESAFYGCTALTNVTISSSVRTMGCWVFLKCSKLDGIYFEGVPPRVRSGFYLGPNADSCVAYYLRSMKKKWGASFGGIPTAEGFPPF